MSHNQCQAMELMRDVQTLADEWNQGPDSI